MSEQGPLTGMRARCATEGGVFWLHDDELAVFDAATAQRVDAANFADLTLTDRFRDQLRRRASAPVSWKQLRSAWTRQLRRLAVPAVTAALAARMERLVRERADRPLDLVTYATDVTTHALLPMIVEGLPPRDADRLDRDVRMKFRLLAGLDRYRPPGYRSAVQIVAGRVMRRELRGRADGTRPRRTDLVDPIVDLLSELGIDRAAEAATTLTTALVGSPIPISACLLFELSHRPEWAARLETELAAVAPADLAAAPTTAAPVTYRFVKEVLRKWGGPSLFIRDVRTDIAFDQVRLSPGQHYRISNYLIHHDRRWIDPDTFDPDRWLPGAPNGPSAEAPFVPFGWSPRGCIAPRLGQTLLILLCRLHSTGYRVVPAQPDRAHITVADAPIPRQFHGTVVPR